MSKERIWGKIRFSTKGVTSHRQDNTSMVPRSCRKKYLPEISDWFPSSRKSGGSSGVGVWCGSDLGLHQCAGEAAWNARQDFRQKLAAIGLPAPARELLETQVDAHRGCYASRRGRD